MSNTESLVFPSKSTPPTVFLILVNGNHSFSYLSPKPWSHTRQNHVSSTFKMHSESNKHFSPPPPLMLCGSQRRFHLECCNNLQTDLSAFAFALLDSISHQATRVIPTLPLLCSISPRVFLSIQNKNYVLKVA